MAININKLIILLLILMGMVCYGQVRQDSVKDESSKFYNIAVNKVSDEGKWIVATKVYRNNYDSAVVLATGRSGVKSLIGTLNKKYQYSFVRGDQLLALGQGKALLWNLRTGMQKELKTGREGSESVNVLQSGVMEKGDKYFLQTSDSVLYIYDAKSALLEKVERVQYFRVSNSGSVLYIVKKSGRETQLMKYSGNKVESVYAAPGMIRSMEETPSGSFLILKEEATDEGDSNSSLQKVVLLDTKRGELVLPDIDKVRKEEYLRFTEIQNGNSIMITGMIHVPAEKGTVDIWYGNDGNLEAKQEGSFVNRYWIWKKDGNKLMRVPSDRFSTVISLNNPDYFLMFNREELQNYSTLFPLIHGFLYDRKKETYEDLGIMQAELSVSDRGSHFVFKNKDGLWVLVDTETFRKIMLEKKDLTRAYFSPDSRTIFFENSSDLWKYEINKGQFTALNIDHENEVKVVTKDETDLYPESGYNFRKSILNVDAPLLLAVTRKGTIEKTFLKWEKGRFETLMASSASNITWYKTDESLKKAVYVEESLHFPPRIVSKEIGKEKGNIVFQSNAHDKISASIRRDVISFNSRDGVAMKGLLYYPIGYTEGKKYPMVVHIYEVQSRNPNQYLSPLNNFPVGFSIRKLLQEGYFVYLPDITNGPSGVGQSALDCVESSLDALKTHAGVDLTSVGLIGHSFGGYRTNFIAGHSHRFKTYISGAGAGDLTRMYFSYNETSSTPFYWQFEEGQYNMHASFAEDKRLYVDNNPIEYVHKVNAPMLLWTGMEDKRIVWDQTMEFYIGLKKNKKDVVALFYSGEAHVFTTGSKAEKDLELRIQDWWDYFLKGKRGISWIDKQIKKDAD
ncbi:dipeptidyl aminopeptidase/acylaminoacyl peptidase [Chryseobacterium vietnamense]|uniref:Dipeptidyl aminopeptidase/acylaminoacyl peptidase n=1 Tax=Chryseobacterium vietnamense TaxID=866785 RepID=A0ACC6JC87_9FLAO|nr:prolyl oligopeptidase family serine peptidase [Chryseobacterium vietnamense]MDR6460470.1 dipeptidyl aminopeptidase/acylaminoacyl peptidase [Chryseobacterium vietnamense]